jgi:RNA polymerase sigma-70 factor (ECF subfamily)
MSETTLTTAMVMAQACVSIVHPRSPKALHADLVRGIAARDRSAFGELFHEFAPRIKGYLMRAVRDDGLSDELTQEVLLRVWRKAHTYQPDRAEVSTWIFIIARSVMIDAIRRENRHFPMDEQLAPPAPPQPDQAVAAARRGAKLRTALSELPDEQSSVLQCAYFEGRSLREISKAQDVPLGTVKSRVRLAFARLRTSLTLEVE